MKPETRNGLFVAIAAAVIIGLIAAMMYIDSLGEAEGPNTAHLKDAADR